ncbi:MAG: DNA polymerase, partial [bacterium]|nr:DNA polymerase [bacterium]
ALFHELEFRALTERAKKIFGAENGVEMETKEELIDEKEVKKTALALWLVDSNITNPSREDILEFANTDSFIKARKYIFEELKKRNLEKVYSDIELPLLPFLKKAEERGIIVDTEHLKKISKTYHAKLEELQKKIWKEAGERFNINSPQQMGRVLFDHLGLSLKGLKKTEGGARSTRESELLKLEGAHPIIDHILHFRELQKLLSTYIDNIPDMVKEDGRLHTTFIQTGTTTGRMSSKDPNMQNIPASGDYGNEIRKAFTAGEGYVLAAFDYSQIELRVLALLSGEKTLITLLKKGVDIHTAVASEMFSVPIEKVEKDMRRKAKVINFGIIYGMGVTSLQKSLKSTREEAQKFYDDYFKKFPGIADYIERIKNETAKKGYTETLFGRRRYIEGLHSNIPYIRSAAERMAVNAPIQGTATGDIIKLAIIHVEEMLKYENLENDVFLLLQVHDELVYEVKKDKVVRAASLIKNIMEHIVKTDIPFVVDASVGENWGTMKQFKI